jgi:hypothetical protein
MSLELQLAAAVALITALAITAAGMVFFHQLRDNLRDSVTGILHDTRVVTVHELRAEAAPPESRSDEFRPPKLGSLGGWWRSGPLTHVVPPSPPAARQAELTTRQHHPVQLAVS